MAYQIERGGKILVDGNEINYEGEYTNVREIALALYISRYVYYSRFA